MRPLSLAQTLSIFLVSIAIFFIPASAYTYSPPIGVAYERKFPSLSNHLIIYI